MSKLLIASSILLFFISSQAVSDGLEKEIRSGNYCQTDIFDKYNLHNQIKATPLKFAPSEKLLEFVVQMELMCPWNVQRDFNGDKKNDWIGYVKENEKYQLVAIISGFRQYSFQIIDESTTPPSNHFVRWLQTKHLTNFTDRKLNLGVSRYALQWVNLEGINKILLWDGKKLESVIETSQIF